ncbi:Spherulation-specific family 4-domain-containing protein [Aspergillus novoparasiticus]|uniref:Spherulation-specific family 4-domain-containing protein n=1 Tax=Aspergillus novoparasiticus TaxID=986946 RepID=A0A5N6E7V4_9EURO|nr:Spherulation-specific family 4-domain-containing protein [Aspergillus novoparasiticus]
MRLRSYLYLWGLFAVSGILADDIDFSAAAQSISAALADPSFVPYTKPTQKISEFIALGDSYTAGTGCNGNYEILSNDAVRGKRAYPIQMERRDAVYNSILNDCIYRVWRPGDCQTTLDTLQRELDSGSFQDKAGGADPRESFQVDAMGPECNDYTWAPWPRLWGRPTLTQALREQLNDKVRQVNAAIKAAAEDLKRMGVIYVNGIQDAYNGHRYCEQGASEGQTEYSVWFWTAGSPINTASEGPGDPNNAASTDSVDLAQGLLDFIFPGQNKVIPTEQSASSTPPWEWDGAEKYPDLQSLLDGIRAAAGDADPLAAIPFNYMRSFHPKATAYAEHASALFAAIADNRGAVGTGGDEGQQVAIASYINPLGDPASWERLLTYDTKKVSVLVANVLNGPDYVVDDNWKSVINQVASQGKKILGYVRTGYLGVSQQQFTTRLGSHDLADWASQIEQDIDKWYELYDTSLGGIFFDEGWPECGPNNIYADLYAYINDYTKRKHPGAYTVLNPGSPIAQCFEDTMDTLLTFESSYETYTSSFVPNDWTPKDPRKIWHIIYKVPQDQIVNVATLASSRNAGLLEITDDDQPNPYDNLPNEAYMKAVIGAVSGGTPPISSPAKITNSYVAGLPSDVVISSSDYSSVTLTWSPVANALGYAVYKDSVQVLELPASLTRATIGMLDPGTSNIAFEVRAILSSGSGGSSRIIPASTKSLPENGTIANVGFTQNGDTVIYKADVLVPYAFVRLFIGIKQPDPGIGRGWPIQAPADVTGWAQHEIVNYLVEGNDFYSGLYKYTGAWYETTTANADWTWSSIGVASQSQNGYTYTWSVPLAGTDAVASEYVIQGQGYAPIKNVFMGTLRHYGTI